jgi:hypothetical protein
MTYLALAIALELSVIPVDKVHNSAPILGKFMMLLMQTVSTAFRRPYNKSRRQDPEHPEQI